MRRSARAATAMVVTSAFGLVVAGTSAPGGSPTVLAAGSHPLLADHDDGGSGSGSSGSGSGGEVLDLGGALSGSGSKSSGSSHSERSGSGKSSSSKSTSESSPKSSSGSSSKASSGSSSSGIVPHLLDAATRSAATAPSATSGSAEKPSTAVSLPAVQVPPVEVPAVQVPAVELPAVQVPPVSVPSVQVPPVSLPAVRVPSVSVPPVAVGLVSVGPVSVGPVSVGAVSVGPVALAPVALPVAPAPALMPLTPLARAVPLVAPADVLAGVVQAPALPAALPLFGPPTGDQGVLRVAHLSPSTGAVDMYVEGPGLPLTRVASEVTYPLAVRSADAAPALVPLTPRPAAAAPALAPAAPITAARPAGLVVPAAGIDAGGLGTLGLDETGELQAPATPNAVGWYRDGATPGDPGTVVLVGHVDSYRGPGVFWHLRNLRPGDTIDVPRSDGTVAHFGVDAVETVGKEAFPAERVYAPTAGPSLRLITCGGPFDRSARSYEDNVVVFASPR